MWYDDEYPTSDECLVFKYTQTPDYNSKNTFHSVLKLQTSTDNYKVQQTYSGVGIQLEGGKLATSPGPKYATVTNYQVLATDYDRFAFVWDCINVNSTHYNERMWYFHRNPNPSCRPVEVENLLKYFNKQFIRETYHGPECRY